MTIERKGWVCAKDRDVREGEFIRNKAIMVPPTRQSLSYPAGYFDVNVDVWTGCSSCSSLFPHEECHNNGAIETTDQLREAICECMNGRSFAEEDYVISINWSSVVATAYVYIHLRKQATFGPGALSGAVEGEIRRRLPAVADLRLLVQYDQHRVCTDCGCADESKLRLNQARGHRGAMECYACVPKRGHERLEDLIKFVKGGEIGPGEDVEAHVMKIMDAAESALAAPRLVRQNDKDALARALFYCRHHDEIFKKAEIREDIRETVPRFMRAADIMWSLDETGRAESRQEAIRLMDMEKRYDRWAHPMYEIKHSDVLAPVNFTFKWME